MTGSLVIPATATNSATTSGEVQVPSGFTLVGIEFPVEITSTTFTINHSSVTGGTFSPLQDPLGIYTTTAGDPVTFTCGATSIGTHLIPPAVSALFYSYIKVVLGSAETVAVNYIFKNIA